METSYPQVHIIEVTAKAGNGHVLQEKVNTYIQEVGKNVKVRNVDFQTVELKNTDEPDTFLYQAFITQQTISTSEKHIGFN